MSLSGNRASIMIPAWRVRSRVVTPGALCVTLAEFKDQAIISGNAQDAYLTRLLTTAQELAERYTKRKFTYTVMEGDTDDPNVVQPWWQGVIQAPAAAMFGQPRGIHIPWVPLQSVLSFSFVDQAQAVTAFAPSSYLVDSVSQDRNARLVLRYFTTYPGVPIEILALRVSYVVGYTAQGTPTVGVPEAIRTAIYTMATYLYNNRGDCSDGADGVVQSSGAGAYLDMYRVLSI